MPVEFGELPPTHHSRRNSVPPRWQDEADKLRAAPGQWALLVHKPTRSAAANMQQSIRNGAPAAFRPKGTFEATARGCDVWVRYVGDAP
jgi:hypothetical protein